MERLRIEGGGERLDGSDVHGGGAAGVSLADGEILEVGESWRHRAGPPDTGDGNR
jgi:hypothetical protein